VNFESFKEIFEELLRSFESRNPSYSIRTSVCFGKQSESFPTKLSPWLIKHSKLFISTHSSKLSPNPQTHTPTHFQDNETKNPTDQKPLAAFFSLPKSLCPKIISVLFRRCSETDTKI
jgi:hypothetical protein